MHYLTMSIFLSALTSLPMIVRAFRAQGLKKSSSSALSRLEGNRRFLQMCSNSNGEASPIDGKSAGKGLLLKRLKKRNLGTAAASSTETGANKYLVHKNDDAISTTQQHQVTKPSEVSNGNIGGKKIVEHGQLFSSLDISANTKKAIETVLKYKTMSQVQEEAIPVVLKGTDVFAKAKTGTGKTLAFLIPGVDMLLKELHRYSKQLRAADRQQGNIRENIEKPVLLILSPTRELAMQISDEAKQLLTFHKLNIITLVGGVDMNKDMKAIGRPGGFDIVVATPGRFLAHLQDTRGMAAKMKGVKFLVLDEADRLLDMGFSRDIYKIASYLPSNDKGGNSRQTFLFSATFSDEIKKVANTFLRKGYAVIDTVGEEVEQTHSHVPQSIVTVPTGDQVEALKFLLESEINNNPNYKIMVFFPTARQTGYMAALFQFAKMDILEIHSRKSQPQRTKTSEKFRKSKAGILFSSDVTARGMDYPDVTLVIQMGMTEREQYIHRLGRTARAGKEGSGVLVVHPDEYRVMNKAPSDMPLRVIPTESVIAPDDQKPESYKHMLAGASQLSTEAQQSWMAWLGFYNGQTKKLGWNTQDLLQEAKGYAKSMGMDDIPALPKRTLGKMGLAKAAGFKSEENAPSRNHRTREKESSLRDGRGQDRADMDSRGGKGRVGARGGGSRGWK